MNPTTNPNRLKTQTSHTLSRLAILASWRFPLRLQRRQPLLGIRQLLIKRVGFRRHIRDAFPVQRQFSDKSCKSSLAWTACELSFLISSFKVSTVSMMIL